MAYDIFWTPLAIEDYGRIEDFLIENFAEYLPLMEEEVVGKLRSLQINPYIARPADGFESVREAITKHYIITFRVNNDVLEILRIHHHKENR